MEGAAKINSQIIKKKKFCACAHVCMRVCACDHVIHVEMGDVIPELNYEMH